MSRFDPDTTRETTARSNASRIGRRQDRAQLLAQFMIPRLLRRTMTTTTLSQWGDWPATRVRSTFLDYFAQHGHSFVKSSSTIPYEDPTLLFANAGYVIPSRDSSTHFISA